MDTKYSPSSSCIEALQSANVHLELQLIELKAKLAWYEEQYRLFKHKQFGAASERYEGQGLLFNEAEVTEDEEPTEEDESQARIVSAHTRKKKPPPSISERQYHPGSFRRYHRPGRVWAECGQSVTSCVGVACNASPWRSSATN